MKRKSRLMGISCLALVMAAPAWAQNGTPASPQAPDQQPRDTPASPAEAAAEPSASPADIIVTGSRLASGFSMPTPVTIVAATDLQKAAQGSIGESLRQIPALSTSVLGTNSGTGSGTSQTNGQSLLNLRGLGPNRTLVLLDGARIGPTNVLSSVDINILPQQLIKRVDVVTGGASASYGSDAVSGVVNFVLDTKIEGIKLEASAGETTRGDADNWHLLAAVGHSFGDSARIIASADIYRMDGIPYGKTGRKWMDEPMGQWPNPVPGASPTSLTLEGARSATAGYGGTISAISGCPAEVAGVTCRGLAGQQFLQGGTMAPFNPGANAGSQFGVGGDGAIVTNGLSPQIKRESFFAHGEVDVTPDVTLWAQGTYARNYTRNEAQIPVQNLQVPFRIFEDNAYLPSGVASVLAATPGTQSFTLSRYDADMGKIVVLGVSKVLRGAAGLKGSLGGNWSFDSTAAYQHTTQDLNIYNTIQRNLYAASDAVRNPATGEIVCRSTYFTPNGTFVPGGTGQDVGCVPLNLFGPNSVSQAASDYAMGWNTAHITLNQASAEVNLRGDLGERLSFGAGPISIATGAGYRRLTARREVDDLSAINIDFTGLRVCSPTSTPACSTTVTSYPAGLQGRYGGYQYYNPSPLSGRVTIYEFYGELGIPLLKDKPFFQSLDATVAGRYTHYSQSGWEPTWKLGLNWTVNPDVRLRATYSADSRAPSVLELFNTASVSQGRNRTPCVDCAGSIVSGGQNISIGNPNLSPEKARTLTAGLVLTPSFVPGLQLSADYYEIKLKDSIIALGTQNLIDMCYRGEQVACQQITVNGNPITTTQGTTANDFVVVYDQLLNYAHEFTSGIDFEAAYRRPVGNGNLSLSFNGNLLLHAKLRTGCASVAGTDLVGYIASCGTTFGAFPRFKGRFSVNYDIGKFGIYVQERFISGGKKDPTLTEGVDITENDVPATWYTDLNLTYRPAEPVEIFLQITNLLDQDPRNTLLRSRSWIEPSDLTLYDALGRRFVAGVRLKF